MNGKQLSAALRNGDYIYGTAILSTSPLWPRVVASLGLDMVFIDTEHTPMNRETVSWMCQLYRALNLAPLVRIPSPDPYQATMALDAGATGVIAPYVETVEEVQKLVGAVKHKPVKGAKLHKMLRDEQVFEQDLAPYLRQHNEDNVFVINIESVPALESLDMILSVEGLDGILIGPHDLSCSLGFPEQYDHPAFLEAVDTIISKARKHQKGVGVHTWGAVGFDKEILWAKAGANFIMHSSDITIFRDAMQSELERLRKSLTTNASTDNLTAQETT